MCLARVKILDHIQLRRRCPMKKYPTRLLVVTLAVGLGALNLAAQAQDCFKLPGFAALQSTLAAATAAETSGLNNQMWATIVDRDGVVCAVAFSGVNRGAQWPGSRVSSAQKANTANSFSLDTSSNSAGSGQPKGLALSTANLYSAVQPGAASSVCKKVIRWIRQSPMRDH